MSTPVVIDGQNFTVPEEGDRGWGEDVTDLLVKLAEVSLLIKGGSIPLTSEADFGAAFGLRSIYFKSRTANPASDGALRLATTDTIKWRNGANSADLSLATTSDRLSYQGITVPTISSTDALTNKTFDAALNTLSNVDTTMLAAGVLVTSTALAGATDLNFPSTLAVKTYIDDAVAGVDDASEVSYIPTTPADWPDPDPVNVQEGLDKLAAERTLNTAFTAHTGASSGVHGVTGSVVGTTDTQTLTNKTLGGTNTITGAQSAFFSNGVATVALPGNSSTLATLALSETLTNKNMSSSTNSVSGAQAATFSNSGATITLPTTTDTLVGRATTDTLTNKNLASSTNTVSGAEAATFVNSGATITLPTSTSTLATLALAETLTNKTLTAPVVNTSLTGTAVETDLAVSASATKVPSAAAAKAYADAVAGGGSGGLYSAKSANYTILDNDNIRVVGVTTAASTITITLPTAADNANRIISVKKVDNGAGTVVIDGEGAETIDGTTTVTLTLENEALTVVCTGTAWESIKEPNATSSSAGMLQRYQTTNLGSAGDFTVAGGVKFTRINDTVTITFLSTATFSSTSSPKALGYIPADYRPATDTRNIYGFGPAYVLAVIAKPNGDLECEFRDWAGATTGQTSTIFAPTITYNV